MSDIIDGELWDSQRQGRAGKAMTDPEILTQRLNRHSCADHLRDMLAVWMQP